MVITTVIILFITSCANIVSPSGGPKDTTPPKVVSSNPMNYSCNFNGNEILINFNEFIVLNDLRNQFFVSPPLTEGIPEVKIKGKSLHIEFKESFKPQTTYSLFFGNSITDLTEGNPLTSYNFVFSSGNTIDSMSLQGKVISSYTQKPEKDFFVLLYEKDKDSLPFIEQPYYMMKTGDDGSFRFRNLRNIPYRIIALNDINKNLIYDRFTEKIAYIDSMIMPEFIPENKSDTLVKADSTNADSVSNSNLIQNAKTYIMQSFMEIDSTQRVIKSEFAGEQKIFTEFKFPQKDLTIDFLNTNYGNNWNIEEWSDDMDSLIIWLLNQGIDSVKFAVFSDNKIIDTISVFKNKKIKHSGKVNLKSNLSQLFNFFEKIHFYTENPILDYDSIPFILKYENDSSTYFAYKSDKNPRDFIANEKLKQNQTYKILIKDSILTDICGNKNDSVSFDFKTNSMEDLGNLKLNVNFTDSTSKYIVQLLNNKEEVVMQFLSENRNTLLFKFLLPGEYYLKAVMDKNNDLKWDTGNYLKNIQPETIYIYPSKITIRANWDMEENWNY